MILPDRPPRPAEDMPHWVLRPQRFHGPVQGPVVTQKPAEATHLGIPRPALPVVLEAGAQGLSILLPTGTDGIHIKDKFPEASLLPAPFSHI